MPNVTAGYGRFSILFEFFEIFSYITTCSNTNKRYNFIKLLQTVLRQRWKVNLCNHSYLRQSSFFINIPQKLIILVILPSFLWPLTRKAQKSHSKLPLPNTFSAKKAKKHVCNEYIVKNYPILHYSSYKNICAI